MSAPSSHRLITATGAFRAWVTVILVLAGVGIAIGLTIAYVARVDRQAERRNIDRARDFCGVIVLIDDRNQQAPPKLPPNATPEQRQQYDVSVRFVAAIHAYRLKLGCTATR